MKKIFTLIVVALMAMSANAKVVLPVVFSGIDPETGLVGDGWWYQYDVPDELRDFAGYDYIVLQFEEVNAGGTLKMTGDWEYYAEASFAAGQSYTAIATADIQGAAALIAQLAPGSIMKVKECAWMTTAEYEEVKAADASVVKELDLKLPDDNGVITMPGDNGAGWYDGGWIGAQSVDALYKTLVFEVASSDEHFQIAVQGSEDGGTTWASTMTTFHVAKLDAPAVVALPIEGVNTSIGQYAFQNMYITDTWMDPVSGKQVSEYGDNKVVVTRAYFTSEVVESNYPAYQDPDGIEEVVANTQNGAMYNLAGQRVNVAKGIVIINGKKYIK